MSIRYTVDVFCDRCGNWSHGVTSNSPNKARLALANAKRNGWSRCSRSTYLDLCPTCLAEYRKEQKP